MEHTENVELTVLYLIQKGNDYLLQDRIRMIGKKLHYLMDTLIKMSLL